MNTGSGDVAISKTQRWLDLIAFLVRHHFPVSADQVMAAVPAYKDRWFGEDEKEQESVRRMFERDKDELRAAGIPIETREFRDVASDETSHGYVLSSKDFYLPYLRIVGGQASRTDMGERGTGGRGSGTAGARATGAMRLEITGEEAETAIEALRRVAALPDSPFAKEARAALRKIEFDLDPAAFADSPVYFAEAMTQLDVAEPRAMKPAAELEQAGPPDTHVPRDSHVDVPARERLHAPGPDTRVTLQALTTALRARKRVRFTYHGIERGTATDRDVAPYGLLFHAGQWYLIGSDATRDDEIRVFRLGRMEAPEVGKGTSPDFQVPDDFDVSHYARRQPWELGEDDPETARVRFEFPLSLWADRNHHGELIEERTGGATVREFGLRQPDAFLRWLQQFGGDAIVTAPPTLRHAQQRMARETAALYEC